MRRTTPLNKMDLTHPQEEDKKTNQMEREEGMKNKTKEKVKLHHRKIPFLKQ